jgi:hypothetical protein
LQWKDEDFRAALLVKVDLLSPLFYWNERREELEIVALLFAISRILILRNVAI